MIKFQNYEFYDMIAKAVELRCVCVGWVGRVCACVCVNGVCVCGGSESMNSVFPCVCVCVLVL